MRSEAPAPATWTRFAPWLFGVLATVLALAGSWRASPTDDEPTYLGQGTYILAHGDFRAPVLLWQPPLALYAHAAGLAFVDLGPSAFERGRSVDSLTEMGDALLFESPSPPESVLLAARFPVAIATGLLAVLAALLAQRLAGTTAMFFAGALVAASPVIYGHGGLATTDLVATLGSLAAVAALIGIVRAPPGTARTRAVVVAGAALGLALLSKHTALALVPLATVVAFVATRREGLGVRAAAGRVAALAAAAAIVVWAGYGFDVGPLVEPSSAGDLMAKLADRVPLPRAWVETFARDVPVPAARWFQSLVFQASKQHGRLFFRYFDETAKTGWWTYFPVVTLGKMTLGSVGVCALAFVTLRRRRPSADEWVLFTAFALPFAAAVASRHNLGVRHVMPALAPLLVLAAVRIGRATHDLPRGAFAAVAAGLLVVHTGEGVLAARNPVAWWNAAFGGTDGGWRVASGSNGDWGQGLWALRDVVRREGLENVHVIAAGPRSSLAHVGEPSIDLLPGDWWQAPPTQGWLAISTSAPWHRGRVPGTDAPPERVIAGCYRLYRLPLPPR